MLQPLPRDQSEDLVCSHGLLSQIPGRITLLYYESPKVTTWDNVGFAALLNYNAICKSATESSSDTGKNWQSTDAHDSIQ